MAQRAAFPVDRDRLVEAFRDAYAGMTMHPAQVQNLDKLSLENTFTVCTAHQPNIFSGYLYFVYKTVHTIILAKELSEAFPDRHIVPVFYIGSEDADLDELSQVNLDGQKIRWETDQAGAVGRMRVDDNLLALVDRIGGRVGVEPYGRELMDILRDAYRKGDTIASATFRLLNALFARHGLLVLQPDDGTLKRAMIPVFRDDLTRHQPYALVSETSELLDRQYKSQVHPREINLFYLQEGGRRRISRSGDTYLLEGTGQRFTQDEILAELDQYPERFSPNVVLRGLYQETILPDIAFVGGGSEIAYWLELKSLFDHYGVPFPVLVLRNSFLLVDPRNRARLDASGWTAEALFAGEQALMNQLVQQESGEAIDISADIALLEQYYTTLATKAGAIDQTLVGHVQAIGKKAVDRVSILQGKMLRAEKRKFETQRRQLQDALQGLFPGNSLQERVDNFMPWYARYGPAFIDAVCTHSPGIPSAFVIMELDGQ
jgi:bacillithiol biosynthesis cysteine-adding enzyme BshC